MRACCATNVATEKLTFTTATAEPTEKANHGDMYSQQQGKGIELETASIYSHTPTSILALSN